jgi:hypothetical protein
VSVTRGSDPELSYSDHEVQVCHAALDIDATSDSAESSNGATATFENEILDENGLENDEMAELVATRYQVDFQLRDVPREDQDQLGGAVTDYGFGINIDLNDLSAKRSQAEPDSVDLSPQGEARGASGFRANYDEPGLLLDERLYIRGAFDDTENGTGGSGQCRSSSGWMQWRELFGEGPYADASDEFVQTMEVTPKNLLSRVKLEWSVVNYWRVYTVEGARPALAPPHER